jgi:hypothetical protein
MECRLNATTASSQYSLDNTQLYSWESFLEYSLILLRFRNRPGRLRGRCLIRGCWCLGLSLGGSGVSRSSSGCGVAIENARFLNIIVVEIKRSRSSWRLRSTLGGGLVLAGEVMLAEILQHQSSKTVIERSSSIPFLQGLTS